MFRKGKAWSALLGSSNLTFEGLLKNEEFNFLATELALTDVALATLRERVEDIRALSKPITQHWLKKFEKAVKAWKRKEKGLVKVAEKARAGLRTAHKTEITKWRSLVAAAKKFKGTKKYLERKKEMPRRRKMFRKAVRSTSNPRVDLQLWRDKEVGFFSNLDARNYAKTLPTTKTKQNRLDRALAHLFNEKLPIETRIRDVVSRDGHLHVQGFGISLATDLLQLSDPSRYMLLNGPILEAFRHYGVRQLPSDPAAQYLASLSIYKRLRDEAGYPTDVGYALIDRFLWDKGHELIYGWKYPD